MQTILARLAAVRIDLDEVTSRLSQADVDWAPREGMRTIGGQLVEIIDTEMQFLVKLKTGKGFTAAEGLAGIGDASSLEVLLASLNSTRAETILYIESLSDQELATEVPWYAWSGLPTATRLEALQSILLHESYHTGQLVSYLWSRGDDPYKW